MTTLYEKTVSDALIRRLEGLRADAPARWGKMDAGQMCAHCAASMAVAVGDVVMKQALIGKILGGFFKKTWLGDRPIARNAPTDPTFVFNDRRDFETERAKLRTLVERFVAAGPAGAAKGPNSFFGKLTPQEWSRLMYRHLDHHLTQFGA